MVHPIFVGCDCSNKFREDDFSHSKIISFYKIGPKCDTNKSMISKIHGDYDAF